MFVGWLNEQGNKRREAPLSL